MPFGRRREISVTAVRFLPLHRASDGELVAYGRTPEEAVERWKLRYKQQRFSLLRDVPDAIGWAVLSPFL
ncbi:hypothetical protein SAMN05660350_00398 [Geodermatophilus obscurus]|uniref:Uncharacterized protein n=1 Tax=Geodermatophilus obscurus TaxID=1861 RepID=A0A1M7S2Q7_9ACTN|nr:hypothetical protein SAMN05660350_00398 [Geodermatophilus obscurus]